MILDASYVLITARSPDRTILFSRLNQLCGGERHSSLQEKKKKPRQRGFGPSLYTWEVPEMGFDFSSVCLSQESGMLLIFFFLIHVTEENGSPIFA